MTSCQPATGLWQNPKALKPATERLQLTVKDPQRSPQLIPTARRKHTQNRPTYLPASTLKFSLSMANQPPDWSPRTHCAHTKTSPAIQQSCNTTVFACCSRCCLHAPHVCLLQCCCAPGRLSCDTTCHATPPHTKRCNAVQCYQPVPRVQLKLAVAVVGVGQVRVAISCATSCPMVS
jgi:hypothetical protein